MSHRANADQEERSPSANYSRFRMLSLTSLLEHQIDSTWYQSMSQELPIPETCFSDLWHQCVRKEVWSHSHRLLNHCSLLESDMPEVSGSDAKGFMPVILLPPASQCCGCTLLIRNRPSGCTSHMAQILLQCSLGNARTLTVESAITTATWRVVLLVIQSTTTTPSRNLNSPIFKWHPRPSFL